MAKLFFRYSAMNAGKSTTLLQVAYNYEELGHRVRVFTAALDNRYGVGVVTSRLGIQRPAELYDQKFDFWLALQDSDISCLLVEEAQFLTPEQVQQLHRIANLRDLPVICYGLRSDFRGEPFPGAAYLLALADELEELKTICRCERKATMNARFDENGRRTRQGESVFIGGNDRYRAMCARCFYSED